MNYIKLISNTIDLLMFVNNISSVHIFSIRNKANCNTFLIDKICFQQMATETECAVSEWLYCLLYI